MSVKMKKQHTNKERKLWKLKRKNVVLGQQRSSLIERNKIEYGVIEGVGYVPMESQYWTTKDLKELSELSFEMGKNSAKIQRLRTQIQQEKKLNEYSDCT